MSILNRKLRVVPIVPAAALVCSPATLTLLQHYAQAMGVGAKGLTDEIVREWMECVGSARMEAEARKKRGEPSQNEKNGFRM